MDVVVHSEYETTYQLRHLTGIGQEIYRLLQFTYNTQIFIGQVYYIS
jgi:hypothetical protein